MSFLERLFSLKPNDKPDAVWARDVGLDKTMIYKYRLLQRAGRSDFVPTLRVLRRISKATGQTLGWLAYGEGEPNHEAH